MQGLNIPMVCDITGAYFRREGLGGKFIGGVSPLEHEEPCTSDLEVDYSFFDQTLWPILARRVPAFNSVKVSVYLNCHIIKHIYVPINIFLPLIF